MDEEDDEGELDGSASVMEEEAEVINDIIARVKDNETNERYKEVGAAHKWRETQYYEGQSKIAILNHSFWCDFARNGSKSPDPVSPFLPKSICPNASTSINEVLVRLFLGIHR